MSQSEQRDGERVVLIHLSDLHFRVGQDGREERNAFLRDKLVDDLPDVVAGTRRGHATAVIVTGDVAFSGKKEQFDLARAWLTSVCGLVGADPTRVLCVPGNHDVDRDKIGATHRAHRGTIASCGEYQLDQLLDEFLAEADQSILTPLEAYSDFAAGSDCHFTSRVHWDIPLPLSERYHLAFRGAASVINSGPEDDAPGSLAIQRNQLLMHTRAGQINVFLAHHDPYYWSRHTILPTPPAAGASLALYGHTHTPRVSKVDECVEITAGAVQPDEGPDWNPTYNVIELEVHDGDDHASLDVEVWRRKFSSEVGRFVADAHGSKSLTFSVRVPAAPRGTVARAHDSSEEADPSDDREEIRAAMSTPEGEPDPLREVMLRLSNIGAGARIRLLDELGLLTDELASMPQRQQIPAAAQAIVDGRTLSDFQAALTRLGISH